MRSSSVKSFVATLSIFVFVSVAAVAAPSRPVNRPQQTVSASVAEEGPLDRAMRRLQELYSRLRKNVGVNYAPAPPLPGSSTT